MKKLIWINVLLFIFIGSAIADDSSKQENVYIKNKVTQKVQPICNANIRCRSSLLKQFYTEKQFALVWNDTNWYHHSLIKDFLAIINTAYQDGLRPQDYHLNEINMMLAELKKIDSKNPQFFAKTADLDLTLTDAFLLYISDIIYGNAAHKKFYPYWNAPEKSANLINVLNEALTTKNIKEAIAPVMPQYNGYVKLKQQLAEYFKIATNGGWRPIPSGKVALKIGDQDARVPLLKQRLLATGEFSSNKAIQNNNFDQELQDAVIEFQINNGLAADGVIGQSTVIALNVPIIERIRQIELNMDKFRWFPDRLGRRYVIVNIPDFTLEVIEAGRTVLNMPVIVGQPTWQSCILHSTITTVEINPYWYAPRNIAVKQILPEVKEDPTFLEQNNMVLSSDWSDENNEIDPLTVDWSRINARNFPYKIRQKPGVTNSLGRLKFIFYNRCNIYLHDTPFPELFEDYPRDLSHGCIRVSKPIDLAAYLLQSQNDWSHARIAHDIDFGIHKFITLTEPVNLYIIYATAWVDADNILQFRDDIYHRDREPFPVALPSR